MIPSRSNFIHRIETEHHPLSLSYKLYWKEMKRRCIEGFWYEGRYMPGPLYFYGNFARISLIETSGRKQRSIGTPSIRDIEWEKAYVYLEAKGFSGFADDTTTTCSKWVELIEKGVEKLDDLIERGKIRKEDVTNPELFPNSPKLKKFEACRTYLRKIHLINKGKSLFFNNAKNVIDIEARRIGKDIWEEETVITTTGRVQLKNINVGDSIFDHTGKLTKILSKVEYSDQLQYKVLLSDGRSIECGEGHLWTVWDHCHTPVLKTLELKDILKSYKWTRKNGSFEFRFKIPCQKPINYEDKDPDIDPYYLGLWLGDGTSLDTGVTTMDRKVVSFLEDLAKQHNLKLVVQRKKDNKAATYSITNGIKGNDSNNKNIILNHLKQLNLISNKRIPDEVYTASIDFRKKVLEGLIDSNEWCSGAGSYELTTSILALQKTIPRLLQELGIIYRSSIKKTSCKDSMRFNILTDLIECKIERKKKKTSVSTFAKRQRDRISIIDIQPTSVKKSICIEVDNDDKLFLVGDCIVTHNSMVAANMLINHNFLFDGATDYDLYLDAQKSGRPMNSETLVGAIDAKYTKDLLSKSELGLSNLPGIKTVNGITYPSPLSKQVVGTFQPGKYMEASYKVKSLGGWTVKGSRSKIHNRSFADNPLAGNGTGPNLIVLEEVGFMNNLIDTLGALKDAMYEGLDKFGVLWATGTSGEMDAAAVSQTKEVFFNPETYDCLAFENIYEESKSIGMFIPFTYRLDEFRDSEGNIDLVKANKATEIKRENIRKLGNKRTYYSEMQNNPLLPSEAFLVNNANIFPTAELKEHVNWLQSMQHKVEIKGQKGELVFTPNEKGEVSLSWKPDLDDKLEPCHYNMKKNDSTQGCIVIWEHPQMLGGSIPYGMYIAGNDPYDQDQAPSSVSLGSTFIYKTFHTSEGIYEWPVAEYTARPGSANEHHETVRKLLLYYNAVLLYENERNTLKMHFEQKNSLYLLAKTPTILKSTENSKVQRTYGIHMNAMIKDEIEIYTRDWLQTEIEEGKLNLHKINSIPLLLELINYNKTGNFDRVIAFMLVILYRLQLHHLKVKEVIKEKSVGEDFFNRLNKFYR